MENHHLLLCTHKSTTTWKCKINLERFGTLGITNALTFILTHQTTRKTPQQVFQSSRDHPRQEEIEEIIEHFFIILESPCFLLKNAVYILCLMPIVTNCMNN